MPEDVEDQDDHLLEIITDADYAGYKADRKRVSCCLFFMDGNLLEASFSLHGLFSLSYVCA